jgi:Mannosyltransferase (PIG-V)
MIRRLGSDPSIRGGITLFLVARITLTLLGVVLWQLNLVPKSIEQFAWPIYDSTPPVVTGLEGALLGIWQRFDAIYYIVIATEGYITGHLTVFAPGYPLILRMVSYLAGGNMLLAGLIASNLACLLMAIVFYRLIAYEQWDDDTAQRATLYLLFYPTAIYFFVPYAEAVFMLFTLLAFLSARKGHWLWAGMAGFLAAFTRSQGLCLCAVVIWEMLEQTNWKPSKLGWRMLLAGLPALAVLVFLEWRAVTGQPSFVVLQAQYWGQYTAVPFAAVFATVQRIASGQAHFMEYINLFLTVVTVGLGVLVTRRLPRSYSIYFWSTLLFTLARWVEGHPLADQSRYLLTLFPMFIVLAQETRLPWRHRLVLYPSMTLWLVLAGIYIAGGFVG